MADHSVDSVLGRDALFHSVIHWPLVQGWFSRTLPQASPYRLYALSNLGSLLALLSYPFAVEPAFATPTQAILWSALFGLFAVLCMTCAGVMWRFSRFAVPQLAAADLENLPATAAGTKPVTGLWFGLAMLPSVLLLAMTNQVCLDVAVIPFLWVMPLALYLLSFIIVFDAPGWYLRKWYSLGAGVAIALTCCIMLMPKSVNLAGQLVIYFSALFCCCMVCHGELVRLKPDPKYLTKYYLTISAGGAAGGLFVALVAPAIFLGYFELQLSFVGFGLLYVAVKLREEQPQMSSAKLWVQRLGGAGTLASVAILMTQLGSSEGAIAVKRNFYGVLRVSDADSFDPVRHRRQLIHGRILHGAQFLAPESRQIPTTYYGTESGVGQVLAAGSSDRPRRIGVIGLGVGTLASYGRPGDHIRFYEINPNVIELAQRHFTCLQDCPGQVTVALGDARLVLEHEAPQAFDVLVLDAFSGDAIPVHLLTKEAWQVYLKHLKPDGILACHISNLHFDLQPILRGLSAEFGWAQRTIRSEANQDRITRSAMWTIMSRDAARLAALQTTELKPESPSRKILWTDDRSNLLEVLK